MVKMIKFWKRTILSILAILLINSVPVYASEVFYWNGIEAVSYTHLGVYIITDLNSTNGTSVGGYKLQANETVSIQNRDVITVADLKYYFIETYEG